MTKILTHLLDDDFDMLELYLIQAFGFVHTEVLLQLIAEYNHAKINEVNFEEYFLVNAQRLADNLYTDQKVILNALSCLDDRDLIDYWDSGIENTQIVRMNEDRITRFLQICRIENIYCDFDSDLLNCQNPKIEDTSFHKAVNTIVKYINLHMKKPEKIPMAVYSYCNMEIQKYEFYDKCFSEEQLNLNYMYLCFRISGFTPIALNIYVNN